MGPFSGSICHQGNYVCITEESEAIAGWRDCGRDEFHLGSQMSSEHPNQVKNGGRRRCDSSGTGSNQDNSLGFGILIMLLIHYYSDVTVFQVLFSQFLSFL